VYIWWQTWSIIMKERYYEYFIWDTMYLSQDIDFFMLYIPGAKLVHTKEIKQKKRNGVFANKLISDFNRKEKNYCFF